MTPFVARCADYGSVLVLEFGVIFNEWRAVCVWSGDGLPETLGGHPRRGSIVVVPATELVVTQGSGDFPVSSEFEAPFVQVEAGVGREFGRQFAAGLGDRE